MSDPTRKLAVTNPVYAAHAAQGVRTRDKIVAYIRDFGAQHGYGPTAREIANGVGLKSPSTAQTHINNLLREGLLTHIPASPRTLRVVVRA